MVVRGTSDAVAEMERLEAAANVMEDLARALRLLMAREKVSAPSTRERESCPSPAATESAEAGPRVGCKVRIVRKDAHYMKTGEIVGRRGRLFWYIRLDSQDGQVGRVIYKNASGFICISD
jgi:hypothetical protein